MESALQYKLVEVALAATLEVPTNRMGAFRARLRHLKNLGLPADKPGSGKQIAYSRRQVLELLIALEIENLGVAPKRAAMLAPSIVRQAPYGSFNGHDQYVAISPSDREPRYTVALGFQPFLQFLKSSPRAFSVINVSACARSLDQAIAHAHR